MQMRFLLVTTARYAIWPRPPRGSCIWNAPMSPMTPMDCALRLAEDGFATFPCNRSKAPACPHGFRDASTDAAAIRALWQRHHGELVGIATGAVSNLAVLDIDAKHAEAHFWWAAHRASCHRRGLYGRDPAGFT